MSHWNMQSPTDSANSQRIAERDFIALNKAAVNNGLTTAQEQVQYRATHDIRRKDNTGRTSRKDILKFSDDMTFGIPTRYVCCNFIICK